MRYFYSYFTLPNITSFVPVLICLLAVIGNFSFGVNNAYSQGTRGQLLDLRKQLNQIQQKLIKRQMGGSNDSTKSVSKNTSQYESLFSEDNLQRGDRAQAVKDLQVALNSVPNLVVSESGPGSVGKETRYFGAKTHQAVVVFQKRYKDSVLKPLRLEKPTGVVGPQTKDKLRDLIGGEDIIANEDKMNASQGDTPLSDERNSFDKSDTNTSNQSKSLAELRNQFKLDKWSFTQQEKQTIYNMMPPKIQEEYYSDFVDSSRPSGVDDPEPSTNPLQERYREIQESDETSLKEWLKGYLAQQRLREPLSLLQRQMGRIFGPKTAHAQGVFIFGGRIASVEPCPTPPNALQVTVAGPRPGRFAYIPGASQIRPIVAVVPKPGASTLGNYAPAPGCFGPPPATVPLTQGTIILMGVSV